MTMRLGLACTIAAALGSPAALAHPPLPTNCLPIACRATYSFGDCPASIIDAPGGNRIGIRGTVISFEHAEDPCWFSRLLIRVDKASRPGIPERIYVDIRHCLMWGGKAGEKISGVVEPQDRYPDLFSARICQY
jgi:hypothetical protein